MTDIELIEKIIMRIPRLKPFFVESISIKYELNVVRQVIRTLMNEKKVVSVSRGMYLRPKPPRFLKANGFLIRPESEDVISLIAKKTGEIIIHNQWAALNYVGLSTQIPVRPVYLTSGRSRIIKMKSGPDIRLEHINPKRIVMPGSVTCLVVTALWEKYSKPIHPLSIKKIHERLTSKEYTEVIANLDKMPVKIKEAFVRYQNMDPKDPLLIDYDYH